MEFRYIDLSAFEYNAHKHYTQVKCDPWISMFVRNLPIPFSTNHPPPPPPFVRNLDLFHSYILYSISMYLLQNTAAEGKISNHMLTTLQTVLVGDWFHCGNGYCGLYLVSLIYSYAAAYIAAHQHSQLTPNYNTKWIGRIEFHSSKKQKACWMETGCCLLTPFITAFWHSFDIFFLLP